MQRTVWKESYRLGIEQFDSQHQGLVSLIAELEVLTAPGAGDPTELHERLGLVYDDLITYVDEHFNAEERVLTQHAYPELAEHKREHQFFVHKLLSYQRQWRGDDLQVPIQALNFLRVWLIRHIQVTDGQYSEFLRQRGIS